jgi:putative membrane protein
MRSFHILLISLILTSFGAGAAADSTHQQKFVDSAIDPQVFIEKASSGGATEVQLAKMALEKSTQDDVRHFAQMMIESHTVINQQLRELAQNEGLNIADEPTLKKKAKAFVLSQKEGESFDEAYANNQLEAHEKTYKLFRQAAKAPEDNVRNFAESKLETLEHHLNMARALTTTVAQSRTTETSNNTP